MYAAEYKTAVNNFCKGRAL